MKIPKIDGEIRLKNKFIWTEIDNVVKIVFVSGRKKEKV